MMISHEMGFIVFAFFFFLRTDLSQGRGCTENQSICPADCFCYSSWVICENASMNEMPLQLPWHVTEITIRRTAVQVIPSYSFYNCTRLQMINLKDNKIRKIHKLAFANVSALARLDLHGNLLDFSSADMVPPAVFAGLVNLEFLDIGDNMRSSIKSYRDDVLDNLESLAVLRMDGISGIPLGSVFSKLKSLEALTITGEVNFMTGNFFYALREIKVRKLQWEYTPLFDIDPLTFASLPFLEELALEHNPHLGLNNLSRSFLGLRNTSISRLKIVECTKVQTGLNFVDENFLENLQHLNIRELRLRKNNIVQFCSCFSKYLPNLNTLVIHNLNWAVMGILLEDIPNLQHLVSLSVSDRSDAIGNNEHDPTLQYLESKNNVQGLLLHDVYASDRFEISMPPSLEQLVILLPFDYFTLCLPPLMLKGKNNLKQLTIGYTSCINHPLIIEKPAKDTPVSITFGRKTNLLYYNSHFLKESLQNGLKVLQLDLSGNLNNKDVQATFHEDEFVGFVDLEVLMLSSNGLNSLPQNIFKGTPNLKHLDLTLNKFRDIDFEVTYLKKLTELDLTNNIIQFLDQHTCKTLDDIATNHPLTLRIRFNHLICTCESLPFLKWVLTTNVILYDFPKISCSFEKEEVPWAYLKTRILPRLQKICSSKTYLTASAVALSIFLFLLGLATFLYRHRWDVKFFLLRLLRRRKIYQELQDKNVYLYDAFVAYHSEDHSWVKNQLLKNIEEPCDSRKGQPASFKLCCHERDFIPGTPIVENIIDSINNSKKTILVLTNSFVESNWCEFELQMARMRSFEEGRDIILVIMLEPVAAAKMSSTLEAVIKSVTYIEWPQCQDEHESFWQKLRATLRRTDTKNPVCECGRTVYREERI